MNIHIPIEAVWFCLGNITMFVFILVLSWWLDKRRNRHSGK